MRNWRLLLPIFLLLSVLALPAYAQGTIVDVAAGNPDFSTLVAAVQAADPAILEALSGPGPLTVFAPTNQAFADLLSALDLTADELLANTDLLTDVLSYHVVQGRVLAADVIALDGQTVPTLLADSSIAVSVVDGGVVLNETINVTQTDIPASNGIVHIIDGVLVPPSVAETLGLTEVEEPTGNVNIQVAHFSPDTPAVDIYVNGEAAITALEFNSITDWITLPAGSYEIAVAPAGTSIDQAAIGPAEFDLPAGQFITVAAIGSLQGGTLAASIIPQDYTAPAEGQARVTVFHAIEDAPAIDVLVDGSTELITQLGFPGTLGSNDGIFTVDVPAGTYNLSVVPTGETTPVVLDLPGTTFEAGSISLVGATGTLAQPSVALYVATSAEAAALRDAVADPSEASGTIADIVVASTQADEAEFTVLLAAVQAADPAVLQALSGDAPLTVFAPTDAAFEALFTQLGLSAEDVLAQPDLLTQILLYHVVEGAVPAATVITLDGQSVPTLLEGESVAVSIVNGGVVLNDTINVIQTDILASNGVVHVIDGVLLPQVAIEALG